MTQINPLSNEAKTLYWLRDNPGVHYRSTISDVSEIRNIAKMLHRWASLKIVDLELRVDSRRINRVKITEHGINVANQTQAAQPQAELKKLIKQFNQARKRVQDKIIVNLNNFRKLSEITVKEMEQFSSRTVLSPVNQFLILETCLSEYFKLFDQLDQLDRITKDRLKQHQQIVESVHQCLPSFEVMIKYFERINHNPSPLTNSVILHTYMEFVKHLLPEENQVEFKFRYSV